MPDPRTLKKTALHAEHCALGARMVEFGGWDMPVQYSGVIEEHRATRQAAGLFDVSHMGEIEVRGPGALELVNRLTPNDAGRLAPGRVQYSALTRPDGTFVDDILVYCLSRESYLLVVNASNTEKDFAWIAEHPVAGAVAVNRSAELAQLAVQGPKALEVMRSLLPQAGLEEMGYYHFERMDVAGDPGALVSRTGYTGEDGFEVYIAAARAPELWHSLLACGEKHGLRPCGLGARDTLRLEAKLPLYGNDIDETTTVIEAGLGWIVRPEKGEFIGREVLVQQKQSGAPRRLVGFELTERGIARHGYPVRLDGATAGQVTSGTHSPTLERSIGLVYLPAARAIPGQVFEVDVRGNWLAARVVSTPFVLHRTVAPRPRTA